MISVFLVTFVNATAFFFCEGVGATASLFPGGILKNVTDKSPGNPVLLNQYDDDLGSPEVFPLLCAICIRRLANVVHDV